MWGEKQAYAGKVLRSDAGYVWEVLTMQKNSY
jgi:hypothetical protein